MNNRAQIDISFNWIYVLVAGGIILLFFVGMVVKQKQVSDQHLAQDLIGVMQSILGGASVSEKTKNVVNLQGLQEHTFTFSCQDGTGNIGLEGKAGQVDVPIIPIFSPFEIKSTHLVAWSIPYKLPFKVMDLLIVTNPDIQYVISGNSLEVDEFVKSSAELNVEVVPHFDDVIPRDEKEIRLIDFGSNQLLNQVPESLKDLDDDSVSAVSFAANQVTFLQKQDSGWKSSAPVSIVYIINNNAAKYAAIFSENDQIYQCNFQKVWKRLPLIIEMYAGAEIGQGRSGGKLQQLLDYYNDPSYHQSNMVKESCLGYLQSNAEGNMKLSLTKLYNLASACSQDQTQSICVDLNDVAAEVDQINQNLYRECKALY